MYEGRLAEISVSNASLEIRLDINQRFSTRDFHGWLQSRLGVCAGEAVLDVGCGSGAQSLAMLKSVGPGGSVSALDLSSDSIAGLRTAARNSPNLQATVSDMQDVGRVIRDEFRVKQYDLAQSTYALYYSARPLEVLDSMRSALKPGGRLAVCTPNDPHSLSLLCGRFLELPRLVVECGRFGPEVLEPYFRHHFTYVDIHLLRNEMTFSRSDDVMQLLQNAAYFDASIERLVRNVIDNAIAETGSFNAQKNSYLIVGHLD